MRLTGAPVNRIRNADRKKPGKPKMNDADIRTETADATLGRKQCDDRISSYRSRLENARFALYGTGSPAGKGIRATRRTKTFFPEERSASGRGKPSGRPGRA